MIKYLEPITNNALFSLFFYYLRLFSIFPLFSLKAEHRAVKNIIIIIINTDHLDK